MIMLNKKGTIFTLRGETAGELDNFYFAGLCTRKAKWYIEHEDNTVIAPTKLIRWVS